MILAPEELSISAAGGPQQRSSGEPQQRSTAGKHSSGKGVDEPRRGGHYFSSGVPIDKTAARLAALGISKTPNQPQPCVLPGHDHSARVHPGKRRHWLYSCEQLDRSLEVAGVRAAIAYGDCNRRSKVALCRWAELLDCEAGLLQPTLLDLHLPDGCPQCPRKLAQHMRLFVGLRDRRFPLAAPFVFTDSFAVAYTDLTKDQAREGREWLERQGVIRREGVSNRAIEWKLAAQDDALLVANALARYGRDA